MIPVAPRPWAWGWNLAVLGSTPVNPPVSGNTITPSVELELNIFPGNGVGGMGYSVNTKGASANGTSGKRHFNEYSRGCDHLLRQWADGSDLLKRSQRGDVCHERERRKPYSGFRHEYCPGWFHRLLRRDLGPPDHHELQLREPGDPAPIAPNGNNVVVSWPGSIAGYTLQESSSLTSVNWVNVTNLSNLVNGQNEVIVPNIAPTCIIG